MATSSKRPASSSKQSSAGKTRVLSVKRKDALPRKANVSTARLEVAVQPPSDAPMETLAAVTRPRRPRTTRAAGRASGKLKKVEQVEMEVEASAILEETTIVEAPSAPAPAVPAPAAPAPAPVAPAPHDAKRDLLTVVSRLLSTLRRWTGVR